MPDVAATPRSVVKRFVLTSAPTPPAAPELTFAALVAVLGHESLSSPVDSGGLHAALVAHRAVAHD